MDELIDILDGDGNLSGKTAMKSQAHANGLFHPTVNIWCYTQKGDVLIQQRGKLKDTHPLLWDVSVAGHIVAGENIEQAAVREVKEEIGIQIQETDLQKIGIFKSVQKHGPNLTDCEFHHTFLYELGTPLQKLKKQENEVERLSFITLTQLENEVLKESIGNKYVPHSQEYYQFIFKAIKEKL